MTSYEELIDDLPTDTLGQAMALRNGVLAMCEGRDGMNAQVYRYLRRAFMDDPRIPSFIKASQDTGALWACLKALAPKWEPRRQFVREKFHALIDYLESGPSPADSLISAVVDSFDADGVRAAWEKALARRESDPSGALTAARTLLETVCKHILDDAGATGSYGPGDDLPKLYRLVAERLDLAPSKQTDEALRRALGGASNVVEGLCTLRNKAGDAHADGRSGVSPTPHHAALAVNMAGSMALFLIETAASQSHF